MKPIPTILCSELPQIVWDVRTMQPVGQSIDVRSVRIGADYLPLFDSHAPRTLGYAENIRVRNRLLRADLSFCGFPEAREVGRKYQTGEMSGVSLGIEFKRSGIDEYGITTLRSAMIYESSTTDRPANPAARTLRHWGSIQNAIRSEIELSVAAVTRLIHARRREPGCYIKIERETGVYQIIPKSPYVESCSGYFTSIKAANEFCDIFCKSTEQIVIDFLATSADMRESIQWAFHTLTKPHSRAMGESIHV